MDVILSAVKLLVAAVYLTNIGVSPKSSEKHTVEVYSIRSLPKDANVALKLKKCHCFAESIHYLKCIICSRRFESASYNTDSICKLQLFMSLTNLRVILEIRNVFQQDVPDFPEWRLP